MTVPIPPPTARRRPPDPRASSTFSLSLLPCQSIYLVIVARDSPASTECRDCHVPSDCCSEGNPHSKGCNDFLSLFVCCCSHGRFARFCRRRRCAYPMSFALILMLGKE